MAFERRAQGPTRDHACSCGRARARFGRALHAARRSTQRGVVVATALAWVLAVSPRAHAAPSDADRETARRLMQTGDALFRAGDHAGALGSYRSADRIVGAPTTRLAVARAEEALGHLVEARALALEITDQPVQADAPPPFLSARVEATAMLERLEPRVAAVRLEVAGVVLAEARVELDGAPVARSEGFFVRATNPGNHLLRVTADGYRDTEQRVDLAEGEQRSLKVTLAPDLAPASPRRAAPPPAHAERSPDAPSTVSPLVWGGLGVAAAGVTVGAITGALAFAHANAARAACAGTRCPPSVQDDIDATHTFGTISTLAFVAALAGSGAGVIGLLRPSPADRASAGASLSPWVSWRGLGLGGGF